MPSPVEALQSAGFSEDEVAGWATERRATLVGAGFKDNEIDAYFQGSVVAPDKVPDSFVDRMVHGMSVSKAVEAMPKAITDVPSEMWRTTLEATNGIVDKLVPKLLGGGREPEKEGVAGLGKTGLGLLDIMALPLAPLQGALRSLVGHPMVTVDSTLRDGAVSIYGEEAVVRAEKERGEKPGGMTYEDAKSRVDTALMAVGSRNITRVGIGLNGPETVTIGGLPSGEDFLTASRVIGGDNAPFAVQEKLLKSYNEKGLHPSEVAFDAQTDAVTAQRLLSSDPADLPPGGIAAKAKEEVIKLDPGEKIDSPAIKVGDQIFRGATHSDALDRAASKMKISPDEFMAQLEGNNNVGTDGFVTTDGRYLTRKEAYAIQEAIEARKAPEPPVGSFAAAEKTILDKISVNETAPKDRMTFEKFYTQAVDDLHPLKGVSEDAYQAARLTRGQFGKAEHFIQHGTFDFNTYKTNGKPLAEILEPVRADLDGFRAYLASRRAIEIEASGRKSGMDLDAAGKVVAEGGGKYGKLADELSGYQENVLKYLRDSGVLTEDAFKAMRQANENYIPFHRVFEGNEGGGGAGKGFGPGNPIKRLKGSERDVIDPLESIIKNTYAYVSVAERNAVGIKLIDALKKEGAASKIERAGKDAELSAYLKEQGVTNPDAITDFVKAATPDDGATISAFRNGVKESVKVNDPELVTAFRGLDQQSASMLTRVLAFPAKTQRAGSTLSPDFITRNVIRDFLTAFVNSKGALFSPVDTIKGLKSVITKDVDFQDWLKGGGANSTMVALDRRYLQESLQTLTKETGLMDRAWNVIKHPVETGLKPLRVVSELAENATRLGEFKKLRGETKESIQSAAYASREVTLDFARIGASMRAYNMITAFGNAQIQGLDRIGRQFKTAPAETMLKVAGSITLPSVLLWWANKDDPRYKELPSWQRDMFWIVMTKDHIYRIPKPFELGVVFGSGVERILDATFGKNPDAFDKLGKSIMDVILPNYMPTAAQPLIEQFSNRSTFADRTLIPADMEKHLPEYQYTPYTTETAKALGKIVSAFPGMRTSAVGPGAPFGPVARAVTSPILLENYLRSWTGGMGTYALQAADAGLRKSGILPDPVKPTATLSDIPVVRAFMVRYPSATTQSIQDFMDAHETNKKFFDTWSAKAKEGDAEAMERIQKAGGPMMFVRLDAIKETLGEHSKLVRDIYKNPTMKAEEKRQLIDSLYFNMIEIGKAGNSMVKESKKALGGE